MQVKKAHYGDSAFNPAQQVHCHRNPVISNFESGWTVTLVTAAEIEAAPRNCIKIFS